jgi:transcriptional regulator with XRE-family HTH domain
MLDRLSASLAENLRRLREARGLTQQQLSEASGVPRPTLAHLESGSANPTLSVLARVATTLGVAMEQLVAANEALLEHHPCAALSERDEAGSVLRELCPDSSGGLTVERIEMAPRARLERALGRHADKSYVACERGEVDVTTAGERQKLGAGDVLVVKRGAAHVFMNRSRTVAVLYSVRLAAWPS